MADIEQTAIVAKNGTPLTVKDIATVVQGPKIRLGQIGKAIHRSDGVMLITMTSSKGSYCFAKAPILTTPWLVSTQKSES